MQLPQVNHAAAIAAAAGATALETATIPVGMNTPCEIPQKNAPIIKSIIFEGAIAIRRVPTARDNIAQDIVIFFVIFVI